MRGTTQPASIQFSALARDLNKMGAAQRRRLRAEFNRIGQAALSDARSRASWSRRIPSAITTRPITDMTRGRVGVELRVSKDKAPHARAYEGLGQSGSFRHPVFADPNVSRSEWTWTQKNSQFRPFVWPAARGRAADAQRAVEQTFEDAARECGFR